MKKEFLIEAIDFIENFDQKNISITFLSVIGRSGSALLHSFLDNHDEILTLPSIILFYQDWDKLKEFTNDLEYLTNKLIYFSSMRDNLFITNMSESKENLINIKKELLYKNMLKILKVVHVNRKNTLLALHLSYAYIFDIDIKKIKTILIHHHFFRYKTYYEIINSSIEDYLKLFFKEDEIFFYEVKQDFNKIRIISTIRNPFDSFTSYLSIIYHQRGYLNLIDFFLRLDTIFYNFFDALNYYSKYKIPKENFKLVEFENIHKNTEALMREISEFLEVKFSKNMLESTFQGKTWNTVSGTTPNRNFQEWKIKFSQEEKDFCSILFNNLAEVFHYEKISTISTNMYSKFISYELRGYFIDIFKYFRIFDKKNIYNSNIIVWIEIYNILRKTLMSIASNNYKLEIENSFFYNNIQITIQYKINTKIPLLDNSFLILFQSYDYTYLPIDWVELYNQKVDIIFVTSNFIKENYIKSGIIPEKIKVINYGIDDYLLKSKVNLNLGLPKGFKFLFYANLNKNVELKSLIDSFYEEFKDEKNVHLIIKDMDYQNELFREDKNKKHDEIISYSKRKNVFVITKIILDTEIYNLLDECNCYVYPYYEESDCIPLLQAMSCGLPVITTNGGSALDFCNNENSFLVDSKLVDSGITTFLDMELVHEHQYFEPDKKHLKKLMRYVYENQEEAKVKGKKARETIVNNFTWEHTMNKIDESIEELRDKPIVRFNIDSIKAEHLEKANIFLDNKEYDKAEFELEVLTNYESNNQDYLYKLGLCYYHQEKYEECIEVLSQALDLGLLNYDIVKLIADSLEKTGEDETAQLYYDKANEFL